MKKYKTAIQKFASKGGVARAKKLTAKRRREIALLGVKARQAKRKVVK